MLLSFTSLGATDLLCYLTISFDSIPLVLTSFKCSQGIYVLYRDDGILKLPYCICIAGIVCALFAFGIPHLSALRVWLGFSTFFSLIYIIGAVVLSLKDGTTNLPHDIFVQTSIIPLISGLSSFRTLYF